MRALPSTQMFEHMMKRHDVLFVYVGGDSPLKVSAVCVDPLKVCPSGEKGLMRASVLQEKYNDAASELIVYTYFFSASEDAVPEVQTSIIFKYNQIN